MTDTSKSRAAILAWLATVHSSDAPDEHQEQAQPSHPRKRRRIHPNAVSKLPLSPPGSHSTHSVHSLMDSTPRMGRKRKHDDSLQDDASPQDKENGDSDEEQGADTRPNTHDINATPRASQLKDRQTPSLSSASSVASRTSSPTKQLRRLALEADGFVHRKFIRSRAELPPSLAELIKALKDIARGFRLIPQDMRTEYADLDIPDDAFSDEREPRTPEFRYPPRSLVVLLLNQATDCEVHTLGESNWNTEVHLPMMNWVLRPNYQCGLVDYTFCTGAQVAKAYKAKKSPSNMVDFCMVIRPPAGSPEAECIDEVRKERPDVTINHTDHGILSKSPIAVSFETKRPGSDLEKAIVQIGTWHSSQWRSLAKGPNDSPAIPFLAGVIISGHSWSFVASAIKDGKSVLYSEVDLGKTSTEFGIITTLVALQHLARWAENSYWPIFKSEILQM